MPEGGGRGREGEVKSSILRWRGLLDIELCCEDESVYLAYVVASSGIGTRKKKSGEVLLL